MLTDVSLDSSFEEQLENQQVSKRDADTAKENQKIETKEGTILQIKSKYEAERVEISSETAK